MTIRDRDRKILWGRSGNRCALCRRELVVDGTVLDRESVTGQEAHIGAQSPSGPRGASDREGDAYENLILLCAVHHKMVDDQPATYPATELRRLKAEHEAWVARSLDVVRTVGPRPVDLPMLPPRLVNREQELAAITEVMERARNTPRASVVVLTGMHGVGKSALGAHWVMRNWERFDGGQLVGDFSRRRHRGVVDVAEILGDFLRELGTAEEAIPATLADKRRMFLDVTVTRRMVMLLDDIDHAAQVSTVLPAGTGSVVIVTSNHDLQELLYDGAALVPLDPLDIATSRRLLVDLGGEARVRAEPEAIDRLIDLCGGLPLALRVCGARLVGRDRSRSVASVVDGIEGAADRLGAMSGTGNYAIDAIFDFAYGDLPTQAQLVYRRLGLHPGGSLAPAAVAALVGDPVVEVAAHLEILLEAHLVEVAGEIRYWMHDLVRHHARTRVQRDDSSEDRDQAIRRFLDWIYGALQLADRAVFDVRLRLSELDLAGAADLPTFRSGRDAFDWFDREREVVAAAVRMAVEIGWDERVWRFAEALWPFCYNQKLYSLWFEAYEAGVLAGERLGNHAVVARMRSALARAFSDQGDFGRAASEMHAADEAVGRCDNDVLKASVVEFGAIMRFERGNVAGALERFRRARAMNETCGSVRGVAIQDYQIGKCLIALGASDRALDPLTRAHASFVALDDTVIAGRALRRLGEAFQTLGRHAEARSALLAALEIAESLDLRFDQAESLEALAAVADAEHDRKTALVHRNNAIRLYREIGHPRAKSLSTGLDATGSA